jgi:hypothetical protein
MAKNIRVSDSLYEQALADAHLQHRSLAQQVEFWARLGMAAERKGADAGGVTALEASLEATRRQDILDVAAGRRTADSLYFIPRALARKSTARFRVQDP